MLKVQSQRRRTKVEIKAAKKAEAEKDQKIVEMEQHIGEDKQQLEQQTAELQEAKPYMLLVRDLQQKGTIKLFGDQLEI